MAVGLFTVWIVGVSVIIYLQRCHPVTKYKDAYQTREEEQRGVMEDVNDEKSEGFAVPPSLPTAVQGESGMAR